MQFRAVLTLLGSMESKQENSPQLRSKQANSDIAPNLEVRS